MSEEKKQCDNKSCDKESCAGCSHANGNGVPKEQLNAHSKITKVIGVVSGKGGVGKSMVTASLANEMALREGRKHHDSIIGVKTKNQIILQRA